MPFQWDPDKAESNVWKHGISFEIAITVFGDSRLLLTADLKHSDGEEREWAIGEAETGQVVICAIGRMRLMGGRGLDSRRTVHWDSIFLWNTMNLLSYSHCH
jgi:uncharacterized protein